MNAEDFVSAVIAIILLRRVLRKPRKQWIRAIFKEREEKGAYYQLIKKLLKTFIIKALVFFYNFF